MAVLTIIFSDQDTSQEIITMDELIAAIPDDPRIPSIYTLDTPGQSIQVVFGSPDRQHHTVKRFTTRVEKTTYDSIDAARSAFLELAQAAL